MIPTKLPECNAVLTGQPVSPPNGVVDVPNLPIQRHLDAEGGGYSSFWQPTPEELRRLNCGAFVQISIMGITQPPMNVQVTRD